MSGNREPGQRITQVGTIELRQAAQSLHGTLDVPAVRGLEKPTLEMLLRASIPGVAKLEQAMKAAIAAAAGAEQFGREIGYQVRFSARDIRVFALTGIATSSKERLEASRRDGQR